MFPRIFALTTSRLENADSYINAELQFLEGRNGNDRVGFARYIIGNWGNVFLNRRVCVLVDCSWALNICCLQCTVQCTTLYQIIRENGVENILFSLELKI